MNRKYIVELTSQERAELREIINAKRMAAHKRRHARMLLKLDQGPDGPAWPDTQVAAAFDCTARSDERLRRRSVEGGLNAALEVIARAREKTTFFIISHNCSRQL